NASHLSQILSVPFWLLLFSVRQVKSMAGCSWSLGLKNRRIRLRHLAHFLNAGFHASQLEERCACDERVGSSMRAIRDRFEIHSAIHSNVKRQVLFCPPMPCLLDFR